MKAIVLERRDVSEFDQVISFYTEKNGKQTALARGVKKIISKNSGVLEPFSVVEVEFVAGKEIQHMTTVSALFLMKSLYNQSDLSRIYTIQKIFFFLQSVLRESESDTNLFYFLQEFLFFINTTLKVSEAVWYGFIFKFVVYLGFKPELDYCISNKEECKHSAVYFSLENGGIICKKCFLLSKNSSQTIFYLEEQEHLLLKNLHEQTWAELNCLEKINFNLKKLILQFTEFHIGKTISIL